MYCTGCGTLTEGEAKFCARCGAPFAAAAAEFRYAGFWLRFWAYLIDCAILGLIPLLIAVIIAPLFFTGVPALAFLGVWIFMLPIAVGEGWLYYGLMESSEGQATIGKRVLHLKVTGMKGEPVSFGRASLRYFGMILSGAILDIGFLMAGFTEKKQALHDMMASCLVIRG